MLDPAAESCALPQDTARSLPSNTKNPQTDSGKQAESSTQQPSSSSTTMLTTKETQRTTRAGAPCLGVRRPHLIRGREQVRSHDGLTKRRRVTTTSALNEQGDSTVVSPALDQMPSNTDMGPGVTTTKIDRALRRDCADKADSRLQANHRPTESVSERARSRSCSR